jgi:hypothetical protein
LGDDRINAELGFRALAASNTLLAPQTWVGDQSFKGSGEGVGILGRNNEPIVLVSYDLAAAWRVGRDDGSGRGCRFKQAFRYALTV